jgi:hypothetical protein
MHLASKKRSPTMRLRHYIDGIVRERPKAGTVRFEEARRDYIEAMRQRYSAY